MTKLETFLVVVVLALAAVVVAVIFAAAGKSDPAPIDTDANIGKCIQGQRVLYQSDRGEAAEACLAQLDADGPDRFDRTWRNFKTEAGSW